MMCSVVVFFTAGQAGQPCEAEEEEEETYVPSPKLQVPEGMHVVSIYCNINCSCVFYPLTITGQRGIVIMFESFCPLVSAVDQKIPSRYTLHVK